jgi:hypothetical protein
MFIAISSHLHGYSYVYHHNVKILFLESPEVLGKLKLLWVRNGDRKT